MKKNYFKVESAMMDGFYLVQPDFNVLPAMYTKGSYGVLPARIVGVSYANYLRMCRDVYGATLFGKKTRYVTPYFDHLEDAARLATFLNERLDKILKLLEEEK